MVALSICRESVCMADDVYDHTCTYTVDPSTTFWDFFLDLIKQNYFPHVWGNDVVWTLFSGDADLISWKTQEDKMYSRFPDAKKTVSHFLKEQATFVPIYFRYYSPPEKRAQYIFKRCGGSKFHIWHEGFLPEYESYHISKDTEQKWKKTLAGQS